jgi:hypothetical protein
MKKLLTIILLLGVVSMAFATDMFFVEEYGEDSLFFSSLGTEKLTSVEFTTTTPMSIVSITYGTTYSLGALWLVVDEDSIGKSACGKGSTYILELTEGVHTIDLMYNIQIGYVLNPRLQVIVFLQDGSALSESPPDNNNPTPITSILTSGNMVHVEGCSEVYNLSGQRVDCEVNNGNIPLNLLSAGTYFARGSTGRTTKIVKTY